MALVGVALAVESTMRSVSPENKPSKSGRSWNGSVFQLIWQISTRDARLYNTRLSKTLTVVVENEVSNLLASVSLIFNDFGQGFLQEGSDCFLAIVVNDGWSS